MIRLSSTVGSDWNTVYWLSCACLDACRAPHHLTRRTTLTEWWDISGYGNETLTHTSWTHSVSDTHSFYNIYKTILKFWNTFLMVVLVISEPRLSSCFSQPQDRPFSTHFQTPLSWTSRGKSLGYMYVIRDYHYTIYCMRGYLLSHKNIIHELPPQICCC